MDNKGNNNQNQNNNKNGMTLLIFILAALVVLFIASMISSSITRMTNQKITYTQFKELVREDKVDKVEFKSGLINITPKTKEGQIALITYYAVQLDDEELLPLLDEHGVDYEGIQASATTNFLYNILSFVIPIAICWILLAFVMRRMGGGGGVMGVGKSNAKVYVEKQTGVTFKDVAGQDEAKESLQEVVDFLHNPAKYTDIGAKLPKGALLVGPPGTGKTLLAKAVAGEAKVPFFSLAGSDFVEMFVGVGASRVRDLFKEAQKNAPCIVFIDEIDAIGKSRDNRYGGNDEREQTLNQLLSEMDGFDTSKGILILAATNRPEVLDKALLRPGRFDRRIIVDKPDLKGRKETLKVHSKNVLMDDSVDLEAIALATSGAVGSDLANMINEAAINAVKNGRKYVNQSDLFESVEVVIAGKEKKDRIMGPKEKKLVAYHEVGHALVTALQKDSEPVQKITIIPRTKGALGYTMQVPEEEKFLMTKNELVAHLVTYMGGRAAEEIVFDSVTTGASNDIEQATKIARAMVTQYGMSKRFGLMGLATVENQYLDGRASLNCGEETASKIDKEVMGILQESYAQAKRLLSANRGILDEIAEYLYEHETITGKEFMDIFRRLKGLPAEEHKSEREKETHINFKEAEPHPVTREDEKDAFVSDTQSAVETKSTSETENDSEAETGPMADDEAEKESVAGDGTEVKSAAGDETEPKSAAGDETEPRSAAADERNPKLAAADEAEPKSVMAGERKPKLEAADKTHSKIEAKAGKDAAVHANASAKTEPSHEEPDRKVRVQEQGVVPANEEPSAAAITAMPAGKKARAVRKEAMAPEVSGRRFEKAETETPTMFVKQWGKAEAASGEREKEPYKAAEPEAHSEGEEEFMVNTLEMEPEELLQHPQEAETSETKTKQETPDASHHKSESKEKGTLHLILEKNEKPSVRRSEWNERPLGQQKAGKKEKRAAQQQPERKERASVRPISSQTSRISLQQLTDLKAHTTVNPSAEPKSNLPEHAPTDRSAQTPQHPEMAVQHRSAQNTTAEVKEKPSVSPRMEAEKPSAVEENTAVKKKSVEQPKSGARQSASIPSGENTAVKKKGVAQPTSGARQSISVLPKEGGKERPVVRPVKSAKEQASVQTEAASHKQDAEQTPANAKKEQAPANEKKEETLHLILEGAVKEGTVKDQLSMEASEELEAKPPKPLSALERLAQMKHQNKNEG